MSIDNEVLPEDIKEAKLQLNWAIDCSARVTAHTYNLEFQEAEKWQKEFQRAVNEIKYLKFKKIEQERKISNAI